jgi:oligopeptide/dipeptide ABC transporter ATP-binding protein
MIATAIACKPRMLIADEATSGLDVTVQASLLKTLAEMRERLGMAVLMTTHSVPVVQKMSTRTLVMYAGLIVESGPTDQVLAKPLHPYTDALLASAPGGQEMIPIPGEAPSPLAEFEGCSFAPRCRLAREICTQLAPPLRRIRDRQFSACHFAEELDNERASRTA